MPRMRHQRRPRRSVVRASVSAVACAARQIARSPSRRLAPRTVVTACSTGGGRSARWLGGGEVERGWAAWAQFRLADQGAAR